ncbi:MAG: hypothetical protein JNK16_15030 [Phycisphaerales bacterium]|nr:hypothetical protein [Phycisphaerales bacterium]
MSTETGSGHSLATPQSVLIANPSGLKGQVVVNRANGGGQWTTPVVVGSGSAELSPLPAYSKPSDQLGGGAIGLVPFRYYENDSVPLGANADIANAHPVLSSALNAGGEIKVGFYGPVRASSTSGSPIEVGIIVPNQNVYMRVTDRFDIIVRPPTGGSESRFVTIKGRSGAVYGSGLYYITQGTATGGARLVCDIPGTTPPNVASFGHYFLVKRDCNSDGIADAGQRVPISSSETFSQCQSSVPGPGLFRDCEPDGVLDVCPTLNGRCYADMNFDCEVNDADFQIFVAAYTQLYSCVGDFDGNGNTDDQDFEIFTKFYDALICTEMACEENLVFRAAICGEIPPTP